MKIWENAKIIAENKEDAHAIAMPYSDEESALNRVESEYRVSLDGVWKFFWQKGEFDVTENFTKKDVDTSAWEDINVPGVWQLQKDYTKPYYFAISYPCAIGTSKKKIPQINHDLQETGIHTRVFSVPQNFKNRRIFIHFGAVKAGLELYINGKRVGYSQGSNTPHEFDITDFVSLGENRVTAVVYRYTDGTYLEDQDMWFMSGIYREVYIFSEPQNALRDFFFKTKLDGGYVNAELIGELYFTRYDKSNSKAHVEVTLIGNGKNEVVFDDSLEMNEGKNKVSFSKFIEKPLLWSSEKPNLYTVLIKVECDGVTTYKAVRIGFRQVEIKGEKILVNGQPLMIRGVNRHDFDSDFGWSVPYERYIEDFNIMKRCNINAIRTSHYPNAPVFYDLCDEYGFWVMDECDMETHGVRRIGIPGSNPIWTEAVCDRMKRMVLRDRNHPCVFMWSLGNEAGDGNNFMEMKKCALKYDDTRPFHYEGDTDFTKSDVISRMYPSEEIVEKLGNRQEIKITFFDNVANALAADNKAIKGIYTKPVVFCEYAHCMENSLGNFQEYMDAFEKYDNLCGGFIWDFVDQAIHKKDKNGVDHWLYGDDFNEKDKWYKPPYNKSAITGSNNFFNANGIIGADRKIHPAVYEVKKVYAEMKVEAIDAKKGEFVVKNKQLFSDLSDYELVYKITCDGEVVEENKIEEKFYSDIAPLSERNIKIEYNLKEDLHGEVLITFSFLRKTDSRFAEKGFEQTFDQYTIRRKTFSKEFTTENKITVHGRDRDLLITGDNFQYRFKDGLLLSAKKSDRKFIDNTQSVHVYRALTDNDIDRFNFFMPFVFANPLYKWKRAENSQKIKNVITQINENTAVIKTSFAVKDMSECDLTYKVLSDGKIEVSFRGVPKRNMLCFGLKFKLPKKYDLVKWYGRGEHENYCDRKTGAKIGIYEKTVDELEHKYMRPQENGQRTDVRELAIYDDDNNAIVFKRNTETPFCFTCHHYDTEDLDKATHTNELWGKDITVLTIDLMQRGVGGDQPGSASLREPYIMHKGKEYLLSFNINFK